MMILCIMQNYTHRSCQKFQALISDCLNKRNSKQNNLIKTKYILKIARFTFKTIKQIKFVTLLDLFWYVPLLRNLLFVFDIPSIILKILPFVSANNILMHVLLLLKTQADLEVLSTCKPSSCLL